MRPRVPWPTGTEIAAPLFFTPARQMMIAYLLLWQARVAGDRLCSIYEENGAMEEAARTKILETQPDAAFYAGKTN